MPRQLTQAGWDLLNNRSGNKPVLVVGVNWGLGTEWYGSRTCGLGDINLQGIILKNGPCVHQKQDDNIGTVGSMSLELSDASGILKTRIDITQIEKKPCTIYLGFEGMGSSNLIPLLQGEIVGPISWNEESRSLSLEVESKLLDNEIGFSATHEDFPDLNKDAEGVPWPLIFGTCAHVPVLPVRKHTEGYLKYPIRLKSDVYEIVNNRVKLSNKNIKVITATSGEEQIIYIRNNGNFERDKVIKINIQGVIFEGKFKDEDDSEKFNVSKAHIPKYEQIKLASTSPPKIAFYDPKNDSPKVVYLLNDKISLANHHCYFKTTKQLMYNYCVEQTGIRATFKYQFYDPGQKKIITNHLLGRIIDRVYSVEESGLANEIVEKIIRIADSFEFWIRGNKVLIDTLNSLRQLQNSFWSAPTDTPVRLWDTEDPDIYAVSAVPCEEIKGVFAYKTVKLNDGRGSIKVLSQIPKSWYTVQLESAYKVNGAFVSGLLFDTPFEDRDVTQEWEDQLYVTAKSTIGPNTSDIIKYILETYTNLTIDESSFDTVQTKLEDFPSHFAIFDQKNALRACQEIAWQARCSLFIDSGIAFIKFLAEEPSTVMVLDDSNIQEKVLDFSFTNTGSITTKLIVTWSETYKYIPVLTRYHQSETEKIREIVRALSKDSKRREEPKRINIYKNNQDLYGVRSREENIYIYNDEASVIRTLNFWGNRFSNSWRLIRLKTFLPALFLQFNDTVLLSIENLNLIVPIKGIVEGISFDYNALDVILTLWLPSVAGTQYQQDKAFSG